MKNLSIITIAVFTLLLFGNARPSERNRSQISNINISKEYDKGIQFFNGTWAEALEKGKKENKMIFLDAYASWCGPCKMMAKFVFTDEEVGEYFNKNFINVKMDMEKGEGVRLANELKLDSYPTLFFFSESGQLTRKSIGYRKPKELLSIAKEVIQ